MNLSIENEVVRHSLKIAICLAAFLFVLLWSLQKKGSIKRRLRLVLDVFLLVLASSAVFAYFEFGWLRYGRYMNPHDVYHYYMGAKYSAEHGYFHLYRCTLVADSELGVRYRQPSIRNLETHSYETVASVLKKKETCKALFSPERWEEFKRDTAYWRSVMPGYKWNALLRDKGYNATPVWNALARFLTNYTPTSSVWGMRLLTYIDPALLLLMFATVWLAFGWRIMLMAIIFHGTNYFMAFVHIKGAFMRLDWLVMLVSAICLVKMRWYKTAGAAMAYAAASRVFPLIFCFGLGVKFLFSGLNWAWSRFRRRSALATFERAYAGFFISLAAVSIALILLTAYADGGFQLWKNFAQKIAVHDSDISTTRAGFKYIFVHNVVDKSGYFDEHKQAWWAIIAVVLAITAVLARRVEDYETIPLSFIPVFFISAPTFYYFVMLLVPLFFFLPKIERPSRALGVAAFFGLSAAAYGVGFTMQHHFEFFYRCSLGLLGICSYLAVCASLPKRNTVSSAEGAILPPMPLAEPEKTTPSRENMPAISELAPYVRGFVTAVVLGGAFLGGTLWYQSRTETKPLPGADTGAELVFVGDIMLSRNVEKSIRENGKDFTFPFQLTAGLIQSADAAFGNLECPISGRGERLQKRYTFNAPPESVHGLEFAGFDVLSLANNHTLDYGPNALEDTLRILKERGISPLGVTSGPEPQAPVVLDVRGIKVGYVAYADTATPYAYAKEFLVFSQRPAAGDRETISRDLAALRPKVDILVVSMHWGVEYVSEPDPMQVELGRFIIDSGADIVAGHHPHVQQDAEVYKGGLIIYSMGNYVFDQHSRPLTRESRIYRVAVDKKGVRRAEFVPCEIPSGLWQPKPKSDVPVLVWERQPTTKAVRIPPQTDRHAA